MDTDQDLPSLKQNYNADFNLNLGCLHLQPKARGRIMKRWVKVSSLLFYDISLQDQIEWVENGLPVYNHNGQRIIEKGDFSIPPKGCSFLKYVAIPHLSIPTKHLKWNEGHDLFGHYQFNSYDLYQYLRNNKLLGLLPDDFFKDKYDVDTPYKHSDQNGLIFYKENNIEDISKLKLRIEHLESILTAHDIDWKSTKTSRAVEARKQKASQDWANTVEKAVSLAVECARKGKPKSTQQHKEMWKKLFDQQDVSLPRKEGFEAFRRGLPDDLKGNG